MVGGGGVVGGGGGGMALGNVQHFENWGDSGIADHSQQTDTSTDVDTDERNHQVLAFLYPLPQMETAFF
uniref:Transcription factor HBP-1b(C1) n=1 Tax=Solanum tuberosum TaxID=4113 RepID=M1AZL2_SOLTU